MDKQLIYKQEENTIETITSDNLYSIYDFVENAVDTELISETTISNVIDNDFIKCDKKEVEAIIEIAKTCDSIHDQDRNFAVHEDGRITLGVDMRYIKEHLEEIETIRDKYYNRVHYNEIKISL